MTEANGSRGDERIVIVGAGQAGARAAEALRAAGHAGSIALLGDEPHAPYERPQLSKETLLKPGAPVVLIRDAAGWAALNVDLHTGAGVVDCDADRRTVSCADGRVFAYDRLLLTTGVRVRRLPALENRGVPVHYLRTIEDALVLRAAFKPGARIVVIGGGVIGLETAAAAVAAECQVVVIEAAPSLLARALPKVASDFLLRRHQAAGVSFRFGLQAIGVEDGAVLFTDGSRQAADALVIGVGAVPNVALAEKLGLDAAEGVRVDALGRTDAENVFAAGDVASQWDALRNRWRRVETWANAQNQAIAAAKTMAGLDAPYQEPVWFWTDQYDVNLQVVGDMEAGDLVCRGDPGGDRFTLLALEGGIVRGGLTINRRPDMAALRKLVARASPVDRESLENPSVDLRKIT
jgi:NADPH-dependent 2,4-dienoyl-CoA reductase/sulfur reductase-like enzyme